MSKWAGKLGFVLTAQETVTSVFQEPVVEKDYKGLILRESRGSSPKESVPNQDPYVRMAISVIPGLFLRNNIASCRYATYMNQKWSITSFEVQGGRFILNLGDKYV